MLKATSGRAKLNVVATIPWRRGQSLGRESDMAKYFSRGIPAACRELAQSSMNSLTTWTRSRSGSCGRIVFAESPMAEGAITQGRSVSKSRPMRVSHPAMMPAKRCSLADGLECVHFLLDFRPDQGGSVFDGGLNIGTVETHLGRKLGGFGTPIARRPVLGICFQSAVSMLSGLDNRSLRSPQDIESSM